MRSRPKIGLISVGFFLFLLNAGLISIVDIEVNTYVVVSPKVDPRTYSYKLF